MLNIEALLLLVLVPLFGLVSLWRYWRSWRIYQALGGSVKIKSLFALRHFGRDVPIMLAIAALVFALSDSYWGEHTIRESNSGIELVVVLDISQSMLAKDGPGQRLELAKTMAQDIIFSLQEPIVGVVLFKGEAFTALPLTNDRELAIQILDWVDTSWLSHAGSNMAQALKEASTLFSNDNQAERLMLFFSDGEATAGNTRAALRELYHNNIRVYTVGVGSIEGADVPNNQGVARVNSKGEPLRSALNPSLLKNIANNSNGRYYWAADSQSLEALKQEIKQNEGRNFRLVRKKRSLFNFFVIIAILLISASQIVRSLPWKRVFGTNEYS